MIIWQPARHWGSGSSLFVVVVLIIWGSPLFVVMVLIIWHDHEPWFVVMVSMQPPLPVLLVAGHAVGLNLPA